MTEVIIKYIPSDYKKPKKKIKTEKKKHDKKVNSAASRYFDN